MNKNFFLYMFFLLMPFFFISCAKRDEDMTISQVSYEAMPNNNVIYIPENGIYTPFIVLTSDYHQQVLLLRMYILPIAREFNDYLASYEDSSIDLYLNREYISKLPNIVEESEITITLGESLGNVGNMTKQINRRVFLLSCNEVNANELFNAGIEGNPLLYFKKSDNRVACTSDGVTQSWWLRTPDTSYLSCAYGVDKEGKIGSGNASNYNGIRPAFCVSSSLKVQRSNDVVEGEEVFILAIE